MEVVIQLGQMNAYSVSLFPANKLENIIILGNYDKTQRKCFYNSNENKTIKS